MSSSAEVYIERYVTTDSGNRSLASAGFSSSAQLYERVRSRPLEFRFTPRSDFTLFSITYADLSPHQCSSVRVRNAPPWHYSWTSTSGELERICLLVGFPGEKVISVTMSTSNEGTLIRDIGGVSAYEGMGSGETKSRGAIFPRKNGSWDGSGTWLLVIHGRMNLSVNIGIDVKNEVFKVAQPLELEWPTELNVVNDEGDAQQKLLVIVIGITAVALQIIVGFVFFKEFQHIWNGNTPGQVATIIQN